MGGTVVICAPREEGATGLCPSYVPWRRVLMHGMFVPKNRTWWVIAISDLFSSFPSVMTCEVKEYGFVLALVTMGSNARSASLLVVTLYLYFLI